MSDCPVLVNTVSHCSDAWPLYFGQTAEFPISEVTYVMLDEEITNDIPDGHIILQYDKDSNFRTDS